MTTKSLRKLLIDCDPLVYAAAFSCQNVEKGGTKHGSDEEVAFNIQERVDDIISSVTYRYGEIEPVYIISGNNNFRKKVATILPYKGNRKQDKPIHYETARDIFLCKYDAIITDGYEADDEIGILQYESGLNSIISTIDKDLDMLEGDHYNYGKSSFYTISLLEGYRNFYKQMITGDSTDNILGLYGVGASSKLVKDLDDMFDVDSMEDHVMRLYGQRFGSYANQFYKENKELLWILRERP